MKKNQDEEAKFIESIKIKTIQMLSKKLTYTAHARILQVVDISSISISKVMCPQIHNDLL